MNRTIKSIKLLLDEQIANASEYLFLIKEDWNLYGTTFSDEQREKWREHGFELLKNPGTGDAEPVLFYKTHPIFITI